MLRGAAVAEQCEHSAPWLAAGAFDEGLEQRLVLSSDHLRVPVCHKRTWAGTGAPDRAGRTR
jgi:hypothetical protein